MRELRERKRKGVVRQGEEITQKGERERVDRERRERKEGRKERKAMLDHFRLGIRENKKMKIVSLSFFHIIYGNREEGKEPSPMGKVEEGVLSKGGREGEGRRRGGGEGEEERGRGDG